MNMVEKLEQGTQEAARESCSFLMMSRLRKIALIIALTSMPSFGSEIAVLHNGFSIRCLRREAIGLIVRLYPNSADSNFIDVPSNQIDHFEEDFSAFLVQLPAPARAQSLNEIINSMSQLHHLDPDLVNSIILSESRFNTRAVSPKGAQGLMQLMPQTAAELGISNPFDPGQNVDGGTHYLRELLERYNADLVKALAAYNAGPQQVEKYGGVPPYHETRAYVAKIVRDFNRRKLAERKAAAAMEVDSRGHPAPNSHRVSSVRQIEHESD
jgi:hypothetical protein